MKKKGNTKSKGEPNPNYIDFPCLIAKQGNRQLISFVISAKKLWSIVKVNMKEEDKDTGYQRALSITRVGIIARYIESSKSIPNSVLISFDERANLRSNESIISIPDVPDAGWVIDGQHRLAGAHKASKDIEIIAISYLGLPEEDQIKEFVTINKEAKGVPSSLYYSLLPHIPGNKSDAMLANERATDIVKLLRDDEESPFQGRIVVMSSPKKGQLSLTNFVRKISPLIKKGGSFYFYTPKEQKGIFDNYFRALENVFPHCFSEETQTFFQTLGFGAVINVLPVVFNLTIKNRHAFQVSDVSETLKKIEDYDFTEWGIRGTGSAAENSAGQELANAILARAEGEEPSTLKL